ncbi:MAG: hypothetical protein OEZ04_10295 [Nitrospinota bacterium]|nr:hypothetical protein [Nitrospinota bacterium]
MKVRSSLLMSITIGFLIVAFPDLGQSENIKPTVKPEVTTSHRVNQGKSKPDPAAKIKTEPKAKKKDSQDAKKAKGIPASLDNTMKPFSKSGKYDNKGVIDAEGSAGNLETPAHNITKDKNAFPKALDGSLVAKPANERVISKKLEDALIDISKSLPPKSVYKLEVSERTEEAITDSANKIISIHGAKGNMDRFMDFLFNFIAPVFVSVVSYLIISRIAPGSDFKDILDKFLPVATGVFVLAILAYVMVNLFSGNILSESLPQNRELKLVIPNRLEEALIEMATSFHGKSEGEAMAPTVKQISKNGEGKQITETQSGFVIDFNQIASVAEKFLIPAYAFLFIFFAKFVFDISDRHRRLRRCN